MELIASLPLDAHREDSRQCPRCGSLKTIGLPDGPDFQCTDCSHNWLENEL